MNLIASLIAQTTAPTTSGTTSGAPPSGLFALFASPIMPIVLVFIVMFFLMNRSKGGEAKKREAMLNELKKGDRVQTIGGVLGTVVETRDGEIIVKVDESSNTKMRFVRSAIHRVLTDDKAESK